MTRSNYGDADFDRGLGNERPTHLNPDMNPRDVDVDDAIRQLNSFLRGEISAAETYRMAIDSVTRSDDVQTANLGMLREIQEEHGRASQALRDRIRELGGEPSDSSGAWGAWAKFTQGTANIFGDTSALKSLKEGEEHGLKDYQEGLDDIDRTSMELVQNQLIPAQQRHINLLDQLISSVGRGS
jgi:bacterioferritin (cytochrome b1)